MSNVFADALAQAGSGGPLPVPAVAVDPQQALAEAEAARLVADSDAVGATSSEIFTSYSPTHANVRTLSPAATAASTDLLL